MASCRFFAWYLLPMQSTSSWSDFNHRVHPRPKNGNAAPGERSISGARFGLGAPNRVMAGSGFLILFHRILDRAELFGKPGCDVDARQPAPVH
jgi:hypothetical protein